MRQLSPLFVAYWMSKCMLAVTISRQWLHNTAVVPRESATGMPEATLDIPVANWNSTRNATVVAVILQSEPKDSDPWV